MKAKFYSLPPLPALRATFPHEGGRKPKFHEPVPHPNRLAQALRRFDLPARGRWDVVRATKQRGIAIGECGAKPSVR